LTPDLFIAADNARLRAALAMIAAWEPGSHHAGDCRCVLHTARATLATPEPRP